MWGYYILRDRIPFLCLILLLLKKKYSDSSDLSDLFDLWSLSGISTILLVSYIAMLNFFSDSADPKRFYDFGFSWTTPAPVEWGLFAVIVFLFMLNRVGDITESACVAVQTVSAGGWLYEIPLFIITGESVIRFNEANVFFISFQLISPIVLAWLLFNHGVRPSIRIGLGCLLYVLYFVICFNETVYLFLTSIMWNWWVRLPTIIILGLFISEMKRQPDIYTNISN